ncbi:YidC/Oxa1 family membrane protein insertase [Patescibacteria group bacterium]|nr:MAG: YidC/Oxa1 family membrane protein insertase [Patescibacteria group bacterium]
MITLYHEIVYQPLYNGLVFLIDVLPWADVGLAVIILTVLVKLALFPLSKKSIVTQVQMKALEPDLANIRLKYKDDKQTQAQKTMALYKEKKINPFGGIIVILIQFPIIIGLYSIFLRSGLPTINADLLYSFISFPKVINMQFLGLVDIGHKSIWLALLAASSQYFQIKFAIPAAKPAPATDTKPTFQEDLARSMQTQMKYVFPVMVFFISYNILSAVALYWTVSNLFAIGQEIVVRRRFHLKV